MEVGVGLVGGWKGGRPWALDPVRAQTPPHGIGRGDRCGWGLWVVVPPRKEDRLWAHSYPKPRAWVSAWEWVVFNDLVVVLRHPVSRNPSEWSVGPRFPSEWSVGSRFPYEWSVGPRSLERALVMPGVFWRHPPLGPSWGRRLTAYAWPLEGRDF